MCFDAGESGTEGEFVCMDEMLLKIFELARPFLDTRENEEHTRISCAFAEQLLNEEGGDPEVVLPAMILHDVGWKSVPEELQITAFGPGERDMALNRVHEREGARIAGEILKAVHYSPRLIEEITAIVSAHDSAPEAISLNDGIVKDSDKLWRYTEHGVSLGVKRFLMPRPQYLERLRSHMEEWFFTRTARSIAENELLLREQVPETLE